MEIIDLSNDYRENRFPTAVALGNFDGIHIGHQELIKRMIEGAKEEKLVPSLLLFKSHTKSMTQFKKQSLITNNEQKIKIAEDLGVKIIYFIDFNEELMKLTGEEFVKNILLEKINGKLIVVGFDYRFGHRASGDSDYLIKLGKKYDIKVKVLPAIDNDNILVSSSQIREYIRAGDIRKANKILAREYSIIGQVIQGDNRGSKLGFPTANIGISDNYVLPRNGVYMTRTRVGGKLYKSATNIGYNPTFNNKELKIESHLLDFNKDIYGETIEIKFLDFIRDDIKFDNVNDLVDQMKADIEWVKRKD